MSSLLLGVFVLVAFWFLCRLISPSVDEPLNRCPRCGDPRQHICSWVCVDYCPPCNGLGRKRLP